MGSFRSRRRACGSARRQRSWRRPRRARRVQSQGFAETMTARLTSNPSAMATFERAPPALAAADLQTMARERFGLTGEVTPLVSERDQNGRLKTAEGDFVLKVANLGEDRAALEFQQAVLAHLEEVAPNLGVPRIRQAKTGESIVTWPAADGRNAHLV